jgi:hypothetical protein
VGDADSHWPILGNLAASCLASRCQHSADTQQSCAAAQVNSDLPHRVVVILVTAIAENMAVGMPAAARKVTCLLLACLAARTPANNFGSSSAAAGLLQAEDAACATSGRRKLLQQTSPQPPALPTQEIPFAVWQMNFRPALQTCQCSASSSSTDEQIHLHMLTPADETDKLSARFRPQDSLQPALQQAAQPGRPVSFKTIEAAIYQSYAQVPARLATCTCLLYRPACMAQPISHAGC